MKFQNKINGYFSSLIKFLIFIILFLIYFLIMTPISFIFKIFIKDPIKLNYDKKIDSYWVPTKQKNNKDMNNQY